MLCVIGAGLLHQRYSLNLQKQIKSVTLCGPTEKFIQTDLIFMFWHAPQFVPELFSVHV